MRAHVIQLLAPPSNDHLPLSVEAPSETGKSAKKGSKKQPPKRILLPDDRSPIAPALHIPPASAGPLPARPLFRHISLAEAVARFGLDNGPQAEGGKSGSKRKDKEKDGGGGGGRKGNDAGGDADRAAEAERDERVAASIASAATLKGYDLEECAAGVFVTPGSRADIERKRALAAAAASGSSKGGKGKDRESKDQKSSSSKSKDKDRDATDGGDDLPADGDAGKESEPTIVGEIACHDEGDPRAVFLSCVPAFAVAHVARRCIGDEAEAVREELGLGNDDTHGGKKGSSGGKGKKSGDGGGSSKSSSSKSGKSSSSPSDGGAAGAGLAFADASPLAWDEPHRGNAPPAEHEIGEDPAPSAEAIARRIAASLARGETQQSDNQGQDDDLVDGGDVADGGGGGDIDRVLDAVAPVVPDFYVVLVDGPATPEQEAAMRDAGVAVSTTVRLGYKPAPGSHAVYASAVQAEIVRRGLGEDPNAADPKSKKGGKSSGSSSSSSSKGGADDKSAASSKRGGGKKSGSGAEATSPAEEQVDPEDPVNLFAPRDSVATALAATEAAHIALTGVTEGMAGHYAATVNACAAVDGRSGRRVRQCVIQGANLLHPAALMAAVARCAYETVAEDALYAEWSSRLNTAAAVVSLEKPCVTEAFFDSLALHPGKKEEPAPDSNIDSNNIGGGADDENSARGNTAENGGKKPSTAERGASRESARGKKKGSSKDREREEQEEERERQRIIAEAEAARLEQEEKERRRISEGPADTRLYTRLMDEVPPARATVAVSLWCMVEQVAHYDALSSALGGTGTGTGTGDNCAEDDDAASLVSASSSRAITHPDSDRVAEESELVSSFIDAALSALDVPIAGDVGGSASGAPRHPLTPRSGRSSSTRDIISGLHERHQSRAEPHEIVHWNDRSAMFKHGPSRSGAPPVGAAVALAPRLKCVDIDEIETYMAALAPRLEDGFAASDNGQGGDGGDDVEDGVALTELHAFTQYDPLVVSRTAAMITAEEQLSSFEPPDAPTDHWWLHDRTVYEHLPGSAAFHAFQESLSEGDPVIKRTATRSTLYGELLPRTQRVIVTLSHPVERFALRGGRTGCPADGFPGAGVRGWKCPVRSVPSLLQWRAEHDEAVSKAVEILVTSSPSSSQDGNSPTGADASASKAAGSRPGSSSASKKASGGQDKKQGKRKGDTGNSAEETEAAIAAASAAAAAREEAERKSRVPLPIVPVPTGERGAGSSASASASLYEMDHAEASIAEETVRVQPADGWQMDVTRSLYGGNGLSASGGADRREHGQPEGTSGAPVVNMGDRARSVRIHAFRRGDSFSVAIDGDALQSARLDGRSSARAGRGNAGRGRGAIGNGGQGSVDGSRMGTANSRVRFASHDEFDDGDEAPRRGDGADADDLNDLSDDDRIDGGGADHGDDLNGSVSSTASRGEEEYAGGDGDGGRGRGARRTIEDLLAEHGAPPPHTARLVASFADGGAHVVAKCPGGVPTLTHTSPSGLAVRVSLSGTVYQSASPSPSASSGSTNSLGDAGLALSTDLSFAACAVPGTLVPPATVDALSHGAETGRHVLRDGTVVAMHADGRVVAMHADGALTTRDPRTGQWRTTHADGSVEVTAASGARFDTGEVGLGDDVDNNNDGDKAVVDEAAGEGVRPVDVATATDPETGTVVTTRADLVMVVDTVDGTRVARFPDGTQIASTYLASGGSGNDSDGHDAQERDDADDTEHLRELLTVVCPRYPTVTIDPQMGTVAVALPDGCVARVDPLRACLVHPSGTAIHAFADGVIAYEPVANNGTSRDRSAVMDARALREVSTGRPIRGVYIVDLASGTLQTQDPAGNLFEASVATGSVTAAIAGVNARDVAVLGGDRPGGESPVRRLINGAADSDSEDDAENHIDGEANANANANGADDSFDPDVPGSRPGSTKPPPSDPEATRAALDALLRAAASRARVFDVDPATGDALELLEDSVAIAALAPFKRASMASKASASRSKSKNNSGSGNRVPPCTLVEEPVAGDPGSIAYTLMIVDTGDPEAMAIAMHGGDLGSGDNADGNGNGNGNGGNPLGPLVPTAADLDALVPPVAAPVGAGDICGKRFGGYAKRGGISGATVRRVLRVRRMLRHPQLTRQERQELVRSLERLAEWKGLRDAYCGGRPGIVKGGSGSGNSGKQEAVEIRGNAAAIRERILIAREARESAVERSELAARETIRALDRDVLGITGDPELGVSVSQGAKGKASNVNTNGSDDVDDGDADGKSGLRADDVADEDPDLAAALARGESETGTGAAFTHSTKPRSTRPPSGTKRRDEKGPLSVGGQLSSRSTLSESRVPYFASDEGRSAFMGAGHGGTINSNANNSQQQQQQQYANGGGVTRDDGRHHRHQAIGGQRGVYHDPLALTRSSGNGSDSDSDAGVTYDVDGNAIPADQSGGAAYHDQPQYADDDSYGYPGDATDGGDLALSMESQPRFGATVVPNDRYMDVEGTTMRGSRAGGGGVLAQQRTFSVRPARVDFGPIPAGGWVRSTFTVTNVSAAASRFTVAPPADRAIRVKYTPGLVAGGMSSRVTVEIDTAAMAARFDHVPSASEPLGRVDILTETEVLSLPVLGAPGASSVPVRKGVEAVPVKKGVLQRAREERAGSDDDGGDPLPDMRAPAGHDDDDDDDVHASGTSDYVGRDTLSPESRFAR